MPSTPGVLAERLRAALSAAGLSPRQAALRLGCPAPRVYEWLSGRREPGGARLIRLVAVLGLDPRLIAPEWFV